MSSLNGTGWIRCGLNKASWFSKRSQLLNLLMQCIMLCYNTGGFCHSESYGCMTSFSSKDRALCSERGGEMERVNCTTECVFICKCKRAGECKCFFFFV